MDTAALRERWGQPNELVRKKMLRRLDAHCRRFIALSPFLVLGTSDARGRHDVSPRGDAPGFVRVLDDTTLLIPDRPGNRLFDSLGNIAEQPRLALLFLLPGVDETLQPARRGTCAEAAHLPDVLDLRRAEDESRKHASPVLVREQADQLTGRERWLRHTR